MSFFSGILKGEAPPSETIEQKYNFPLGLKSLLQDWLNYSCLPDPEHPVGIIHSIYFDTPDLRHFAEKVNSDYRKCKVRLRWYGDLGTMQPGKEVKAYLEVKNKFGAIRRKGREEVRLPVELLRGKAYDQPLVQAMAQLAPGAGYDPAGMLLPMADIRYRRLRYVEPKTGARISLDYEICCPRANSTFFPSLTPVYLDKGVLEIKSPHRHLLAAFEPVANHLVKRAFSKYYECLGRLMDPRGRI
jgi:VTC domain